MKEIQLTQGKVALVDDEDYEYLMQWKWYVNNFRGKSYAVRNFKIAKGNRTAILMHREIMIPKKGFVIDHVDSNTLNNLKNNLRICTQGENLTNQKIYKNNKSGYKGVYLCKKGNKYKAEIRKNNIKYFLGFYIEIKDAARAYNEAAIKYHGEFANLNKID